MRYLPLSYLRRVRLMHPLISVIGNNRLRSLRNNSPIPAPIFSNRPIVGCSQQSEFRLQSGIDRNRRGIRSFLRNPVNICQAVRDIMHNSPESETFQTILQASWIQILRSHDRFEVCIDKICKVHGAQLHVEKVILIIIQPSMFKNCDDIRVRISAELFNGSDFISNGGIDILFGS